MRLILKQSHTDQYLIVPGVAAALAGGDRYEADPEAVTYRTIPYDPLVLQLPWQEVIGMRLILKLSHTEQYLMIPWCCSCPGRR
jgi:hypothetical protein